MQHRIQLSTTLLMAVRSENKKIKNTAIRPAGIKITNTVSSIAEKSLHAVDAKGNIVMAMLQEEFAA